MRVGGIARPTLYDAAGAEVDDTALVEMMAAIRGEFEAHGWRRVQAALRHQGLVVTSAASCAGTACAAPWDGAAIPTTTPRPRAS